jgi:hypothetical protein
MTGMQALLLSMIVMMPSVCLSQASLQQTAGDLELRIQAEDLHSGVPDAFRFVLVNISTHDVLLPTPSIACEDPPLDGDLRLHDKFKPLDPNEPGHGTVCANDRKDLRPILTRIKDWKTLHPGESISLTASRKRLLDPNDSPGAYEFWAVYSPPAMGPDERATLVEMAVQFPQKELTSTHIMFVKSR